MSKRLQMVLAALAIVIFGTLGFLLWQNNQDQRTTERRLAELQRQMETATRSGGQAVGLPMVPAYPTVTTDTGPQNLGGTGKAKERARGDGGGAGN